MNHIAGNLIQADHYIIRLQPMPIQPRNTEQRDYLIEHILSSFWNVRR